MDRLILLPFLKIAVIWAYPGISTQQVTDLICMKYQTIFLMVELIHVVAHTVYADGCYLDQAIWLLLGSLIYQIY